MTEKQIRDSEDFKITITVGDNEYEAVVDDNNFDENCCSYCSLNDKCLSESKLCRFCQTLETLNPNCGVYFIEKNVAEGW